jgi:hypothetical protein
MVVEEEEEEEGRGEYWRRSFEGVNVFGASGDWAVAGLCN